MCGIFGVVGTKNIAPRLVLTGLKSLEYRGYDSWGIASIPEEVKSPPQKTHKQSAKTIEPAGHTINIKKKVGKIGEATIADMPASTIAFGHTRWATHGDVTQVNSHPHLDCTGQIAIIHNGIIENNEELRQKLIKKGHVFKSETDTEVAVHLIEEYGKTMAFTKAVQKTFNAIKGLNAIIVMSLTERVLVVAKNGSPLILGFGDRNNYIASDAAAILPHTKQVHYLEDGEMAIIGRKGVLIFDAQTGKSIHPRKQTLTWSITQAEKGKFPYFMLKEICEQPGILTEIAAESTTHAEDLAKIIKSSFGGYLIGCGTASYACLAGTYLFSTLASHHMNWSIASEFGYNQHFLTKKSLVIALSQSGETMDILSCIKMAKDKGVRVVALVNVLGSTLYRTADFKILLGAGPEKGVASTKAFMAKLAHLILLATAMNNNSKLGRHLLVTSARAIQTVLQPKNRNHIKTLAAKISKHTQMYVVGRGISYAAALETALKIKEISYIHAEGLAGGELKHGPLALIEKGTPCIVINPTDETYDDTISGAMEMKARGGYIIGISNKPNSVYDYFLPVANTHEATILPIIATAQLLAYYLSLERGQNPDMPRNLAKSVTVK